MSVEYGPEMDTECISLCDAMNRFEGIRTFESCAGHGGKPFCVWFTAKSLEVLPPLLYYFEPCHSGVYGWSVVARTDCAMSPAHFYAESTTVGDEAYAEAETIAKCMVDHLLDEHESTA